MKLVYIFHTASTSTRRRHPAPSEKRARPAHKNPIAVAIWGKKSSPPRAQPAPTTGTRHGASTLHSQLTAPAPSTGTLSPPRTASLQPAPGALSPPAPGTGTTCTVHSQLTAPAPGSLAPCLHHTHSQLTAPAPTNESDPPAQMEGFGSARQIDNARNLGTGKVWTTRQRLIDFLGAVSDMQEKEQRDSSLKNLTEISWAFGLSPHGNCGSQSASSGHHENCA